LETKEEPWRRRKIKAKKQETKSVWGKAEVKYAAKEKKNFFANCRTEENSRRGDSVETSEERRRSFGDN